MYESTYESSDSQFFRATTGIQSQPGVFDKLGLVMAFLTNLGFYAVSVSSRRGKR